MAFPLKKGHSGTMDASSLIDSFRDQPFLLFFLASFIGGEELMIPLAFLVGTGLWDFPTLFTACFLGTLVSDTLWFSLGRHGIQKTRLFQKYKEKYIKVEAFFAKISKSDCAILLISKFLYGTRIFMLFHFGIGGTPKSKFLLMNMGVITVWLPLVLGLGWFAGKGSTFFTQLYSHPAWVLIGLGLVIVLYHVLRNQLAKRVLPSSLTHD